MKGLLRRAKAGARLSERQVTVFRPRLTPGLLRTCSASPGRGILHHGSGRGRQVPGQCTCSDLEQRTILLCSRAAAAIELEASGMAPVASRRARAPERGRAQCAAAPRQGCEHGHRHRRARREDRGVRRQGGATAAGALRRCGVILHPPVAPGGPPASMRPPPAPSIPLQVMSQVGCVQNELHIAVMQHAPSFHGQAGLRKQRPKPIAAGMLSETAASS